MKKSLALVAAFVLAAFGLIALNRRRAADNLPEAAPAGAERQRIQTFWNTYNQANALRLHGAYSGAVPVYQECLRLNPQHEDSLYYLGDCLEETGDYAAAASTYRRLIEVNPASARALAELGNTLALTAPGAPLDFSQARDAYQRCIWLNREQAGPFLRLGMLELNQGRDREAIDDFHLAAGFGSAEGNYLAGYTLFLQGKYRAALEPLEKVIAAYAKDRKLSGRGVLSEGDVLPAPGKPLTALEKSGLKSIVLLYWTATRLGGYPAEIPKEFRVTRPLPGDAGTLASANSRVSGVTLPAGRVVWSDADPQGRRFAAVVAPGQPVRLYRLDGEPGGAMSDVTAAAGLQGVRDVWDAAWADYDRDGYPDLYLIRSGFVGAGRNALYHNDRNDSFADVTSAAGLAGERSTARACFGDFEGDGRPGLLEVGGSAGGKSSVRLFRNTGGRFVDETQAAGLASTGAAVDCAVADTARSGRLDVFVLFWHRDAVLFRNQGGGRFENVTQQAGLQGIRGTGYSTLFFDYNRDGFPDLLVTSHAPAEDAVRSLLEPDYKATQFTPQLFRNKGGAGFEEVTAQAGLNRSYGTMQAVALDFDADGWPDLLLVNGSLDRERLEPSVLLRNIQGREFRAWSYLPGFDCPANFIAASILRAAAGRLTIFPATSPPRRAASM
ncbi:MAG TPA: FG-GAP-like repeat-containing protein [Terriglobia bacterium]|nr:FG-GAP-like repeat-containing protein [Terriglobia bacterium]